MGRACSATATEGQRERVFVSITRSSSPIDNAVETRRAVSPHRQHHFHSSPQLPMRRSQLRVSRLAEQTIRGTRGANRSPNTPPERMECILGLQAYFLLSQGGYSDEGGQETRSGYYSEGSDDMGGSAGSAEMGEAAGATTATAATEEVEEFDDEAFARRLQEEEQRAVMSRLIAAQLGMAGHGYSGEEEEQGADGEEANLEDDTDPDQMTYEQLTALGEVVGTEQVGVSRSTLEKLAEVTFVQTADAGEEQCVLSFSLLHIKGISRPS